MRADRSIRSGKQLKYALPFLPSRPTALSAAHDSLLICHPASPCLAVTHIEVDVTSTGNGGLTVRYRVHGAPDGIRVPAPHPPGPADGLWQQTCCELFIAACDDPAYREFNFSPSGQWAAYCFTAYRERDARYRPLVAPQIDLQLFADGFQLDAVLPPSLLPAGKMLQLGLTAVIEAADGSMSYWALAHGAAQPDFHFRQSFTRFLNRPSP